MILIRESSSFPNCILQKTMSCEIVTSTRIRCSNGNGDVIIPLTMLMTTKCFPSYWLIFVAGDTEVESDFYWGISSKGIGKLHLIRTFWIGPVWDTAAIGSLSSSVDNWNGSVQQGIQWNWPPDVHEFITNPKKSSPGGRKSLPISRDVTSWILLISFRSEWWPSTYPNYFDEQCREQF